jgi:hypothetical protein
MAARVTTVPILAEKMIVSILILEMRRETFSFVQTTMAMMATATAAKMAYPRSSGSLTSSQGEALPISPRSRPRTKRQRM